VAEPLIAVPDDFPSVFEGSAAHERAKKIGETRVVSARGADNETELITRIGRARVAINIRAHARFSDGVFAACRDLKMVSVWGTGTDNIDLEAAGRRGITVCNTPGVNAFAVAEHAITLMLTIGRHIPKIDREMRGDADHGCYQAVMRVGFMFVRGFAVVGLAASAFGMEVLAWSARGDEGHIKSLGAQPASKDEILKQADFVSLHLRLTPETRGFLTRRELALMKKTAFLINTGRGALVEREALLDALRQGRIAGAGLDVFHEEPLKPDDTVLALPNVVLSPHNAGQTPEVIRDGLLRAVTNLENFLNGHPTDVVVAPLR
jgi:D-3-phosphoglycerate dehydrogenase